MSDSKLSRKRLVVMPLLAAIFFLLAVAPRPLRADDTEKRMRELLADAGPFPDAVLRPPSTKSGAGIYERFDDSWHRFLVSGLTLAISREKACFSIQRMIASAVEMYNMDHVALIKTLQHDDVTMESAPMIRGRYLKTTVNPPEFDCEYLSFGDLTKNGMIYCARHGTTPELYQAITKVSGLKSLVDARAENLQIAFVGLIGLVLVSLVVMLVLFFNRRQPSEPSEPGK